MAMMFCRGCGKEIHESAVSCPHCGGVQYPATAIPTDVSQAADGTLWVPITSLVFGILCGLALFDEMPWDRDTILGMLGCSVAGLVLGVISINKQKTGKSMAITGVVLSSIALLALVGMFSK